LAEAPEALRHDNRSDTAGRSHANASGDALHGIAAQTAHQPTHWGHHRGQVGRDEVVTSFSSGRKKKES
jgi:hypothetical protein